MEPLIKTEGLKVIYNRGQENEFTALNSVDVEVYPEEYLIFFGPSGCGKSTMLYIILGLQSPSEGKVYVRGKNRAEMAEEEKIKMLSQFFGIVFQNYNLVYSLNVLDNVVLPQIFINSDKKQRIEKAKALLERFGIGTRAKNMTANLSGGQQQRVAICRALINNPQVLLADEPVGNLDSESAEVVMAALNEINQKDKKTIILVTHDPRYLSYADRVYYFKDAKIEKMVKNVKTPEGKVAETITTSMGQLERMAHAYPSLTSAQLKAWSLTNYLTQEVTTVQMERMEKAIEKLLSGKISMHDFYINLDKPFHEGGVGLYSLTAVKYSQRIGRVLSYSKYFKSKGPECYIYVAHLFSDLLDDEYKGILSIPQKKKLEEAVHERVCGTMSADNFLRVLDAPLKDGGVGLRMDTANHIAEKLEIILAQQV